MLQRLSSQPGQPPVARWVAQPWRLMQDPKAPPLHLTPAASAALQASIVRSASVLMNVPPPRCRALLTSSVYVTFGVRSTVDLDSSAAIEALRDAFGRIAGGFVPFRITVRLMTPAEALYDDGNALGGGGGDDGVGGAGGVGGVGGGASLAARGPGGGAGAARRRTARRALRQQMQSMEEQQQAPQQQQAQAPLAPQQALQPQQPIQPQPQTQQRAPAENTAMFPEKQVLHVAFRDLAPSNATRLAELLADRCRGAPSACTEDIRRALQEQAGLMADGDEGLRVSMLARPQVRWGLGVSRCVWLVLRRVASCSGNLLFPTLTQLPTPPPHTDPAERRPGHRPAHRGPRRGPRGPRTPPPVGAAARRGGLPGAADAAGGPVPG